MEKIFGEIQKTEELNELAINLRKSKEFDEIRLLCSENNIPEEIAEEFIEGKRLHLAEPGHQEKGEEQQDPDWEDVHGEECGEPQSDIGKVINAIEKEAFERSVNPEEEAAVPMGTASLKDIVTGLPAPTEEEVKTAQEEAKKPEVVYTVDDVKKKLEEELKIYRDGDSKYVIEKLIELCSTDKELLKAIMLPHKSYDKAFQYFYQKSRTVGYKMPHGNMVYLDNDAAVELSVEYFKRDDAAEEKKKAAQKKAATKNLKVPEKKAEPKTKVEPKKPAQEKKPAKKEPAKNEPKTKANKNEMDGQMSLFDF